MEFNPMLPIWLQVADRIRGDIASGRLSPGDKLPGGRDLALQYSINPNTAARVYQELERQGICETRRGLGTFVTGDAEKIRAMRDEIAKQLMDQLLNRLNDIGVTRQELIRMLMTEEEQTNA